MPSRHATACASCLLATQARGLTLTLIQGTRHVGGLLGSMLGAMIMIAVRRAGLILGALGLVGACTKIRVPPQQDDGLTESSGDADESESESGEELPLDLGETGEPEPLCDQSAYLDCIDAQLDDWSACLADCLAVEQRCIEGDCETACEPARAAAESACADLCPNIDRVVGVCREQCDVERLTCLTAGCAEDDCNYGRYACMWDDCECALVDLEYAWAGSCELVFPGPVVPFSLPFTHVTIGDQYFYVSPDASSCDEPEVEAVFEQQSPPDRLTLCEPGCQAFADVGTALVRLGSPPCE